MFSVFSLVCSAYCIFVCSLEKEVDVDNHRWCKLVAITGNNRSAGAQCIVGYSIADVAGHPGLCGLCNLYIATAEIE